MKTENLEIIVRSGEGREAFCTFPEYGSPRAVVLIVHGMAEHKERYRELAAILAGAGYAAVCYDQAGHGATLPEERRTGLLAEKGGSRRVVQDALSIRDWIGQRLPGVPCLLFGHSFGSLVARACMIDEGERFAGFVLSGTAPHPGLKGRAGRILATIAVALRGPSKRSPRLLSLTIGSNNRRIETPRTDFDWLSSDREEVDAYVADPACGFVPCTAFFRDLATLLLRVSSFKRLTGRLANRPVLLLSGADDPVGKYGRGAAQVKELLNRAGVDDVRSIVYEGARHELIHERIRKKVFTDLQRWLHRQTAREREAVG